MNNYEILYIIRCDVEDELKSATVEKYEALVASLGGEVQNLDKWGMKKFAYEINKQTEGFYVLMNFASTVESLAELERQMSIDDKIVRKMIIKK